MTRATSAGAKCGDCIPDIEELIADLHPEIGRPPAPEAGDAIVKQYLAEVAALLASASADDLSLVLGAVVSSIRDGRQVFLAGNGGSANTASHIASDWMSAASRSGFRGRCWSLTESVSRLTALANDYAYDQVFSRQLLQLASPGDVLLMLSVSGTSENLVEAAKAARHLGVTCLSVLGVPGRLAELCDRHVLLGGGDYGHAEDLAMMVSHIGVRMLSTGLPQRLVDAEWTAS